MKKLALLPFLLLSSFATLRADDIELDGYGSVSLSVPKGWGFKSDATTRLKEGVTECTITLTP